MVGPEDKARENIDQQLEQAGWLVQDADKADISAGCGVVLRGFSLKSGHGVADYLFYIDGKAAGAIEAKKEGTPLTGVEIQSAKYTSGLPDGLPFWHNPLPFAYESTGVETRFTNGLDAGEIASEQTRNYLKRIENDEVEKRPTDLLVEDMCKDITEEFEMNRKLLNAYFYGFNSSSQG